MRKSCIHVVCDITEIASVTPPPWHHATYTSIANGHVGGILGTSNKNFDNTAVDKVHLIPGGVLSHDNLIVEGDRRLDGVGHLFGKVLVGYRFEDGDLVGNVSSVELFDFPSQYRRYHVEDFGFVVELAVGVL